MRLELRPLIAFRLHEAPVNQTLDTPYGVYALGDRFEVLPGGDLPSLHLFVHGHEKAFTVIPELFQSLVRAGTAPRLRMQRDLWSPGYFRVTLTPDSPGALIASTESWETIGALTPRELPPAEHRRRTRLVEAAKVPEPGSWESWCWRRISSSSHQPDASRRRRARAMGDEVRTVIAGYHWFTDWGRDTMISLEGLTLCTGRQREAGYILRTFGHYVRDGLIPNMFPEGTKEGCITPPTRRCGSSTRCTAM